MRGGISQSFDDTSVLGDLFSIIVDSGASLSIPPYKSDLVGPIQKADLRPGGMANVMIIKRTEKVEWGFKNRVEEL